ncbi:hypothetical protein GQ600_1001 [Phytophthora cactorum]|nr:hypothetical protein GQ600_1001 [Phytophthora cactorum]
MYRSEDVVRPERDAAAAQCAARYHWRMDRRHNMSLYDRSRNGPKRPVHRHDNVQTQPFGGNMIKLTFELYPLFPEWKEGFSRVNAAPRGSGWKTLSLVISTIPSTLYCTESLLGWKAGTQTLEIECYLPVFILPDAD